jgi:hypothetical protein
MMGTTNCRAGERGLYLYWDGLPPFSRHSLPAFKIARRGARWTVSGVRIRPSEDLVEEVASFVYEPNLPLAWHLPREDNVLFGRGEPTGPDWEALRAWLEALGYVFSSNDEVQDVVRGVPVGLLASFSHEIKDRARRGQSLAAFDRHCLLWSLSPGWEWLRPNAPSSRHRVGALAEALCIPLRSARRLVITVLRSSLDSAPTPNEAAVLALGLFLTPLDRRIARGGPFADVARSFALRWREGGGDPLVLWVRALQVARTKRWSYLFRDLPIGDDELLVWLGQLIKLVRVRVPDPVHAMAVVAGWISECDFEEVRDALLEAEARPIDVTEGYIAETPIRSVVHAGGLSATPIVSGEALRGHPCVDHFYSVEANVRRLLEGGAWYFDFKADSGSRVLAVFGEEEGGCALTLMAEDRAIIDVDPWRPLIEVIRPVLDANPQVRGSASYQADLKNRPLAPLPRTGSLEDQLAWAGGQAARLGAFEFMEAATRLPDRESGVRGSGCDVNRRTFASRFDGKDGGRQSLGAEALARAGEANEETP